MSQQLDSYEVEKIVMSSLEENPQNTTFHKIREAKFSKSKGELTKIFTETNRTIPYRVFSKPGEVKAVFSTYASFEQLASLAGGRFTATSSSPPSFVEDIYQKVKIYMRKNDSSESFWIITLPYAHLKIHIETNLSDLGYGIEVVATAIKQKEEVPLFSFGTIEGDSSESAP